MKGFLYIFFVLSVLVSCRTSQILKDEESRKRFLMMPEVREMLEHHGAGAKDLNDYFCGLDPEIRFFIRFEGEQVLKEELGIKLPSCR